MSEILTNNKYYSDIADTIRQMKGVATTYKPREMAGALRDMYSTEVEGAPPLTFPSNGNNLLNYRIDGANGGVGDRTKNLANDNDMLPGYWAYADGTYIITNTWICTPKIACKGNVDYTFQFANNSRWYGFVWYDENNNFISTNNQQNNLQTGFRSFTAKSPSNAGYLAINIAGYPGTNDTIRTDDLINFQLEESSTATDYEPYGYKIPVVCGGTTTNIYIDEPIGANESKELSDTNVNIPTINGTNILSVNTTVQPSKVYVQAPKTNIGGDYNIKVDTSNNISDNWFGLNAYIVEIGNIDTSNIIDMTNMFSGSQITEIPLLNTQNVTNMSNMFAYCLALTTVPLLNTQNVTNMYGMFYGCSALTTVPLLNTQNVTNMGNMFYGCPELTNESLNNVLKMCIDAVNIASSYKTLYYIGLSQAQATTCATLSNYQDFLDAGWTTGY